MSVELILWVDSVVFDAWFLISTALVFWMHTRLVYGIQGLSAGFFVSASRFLHVAGVLLVLLPSVLDHGASHRQKTGLRRWGSAGAPFR